LPRRITHVQQPCWNTPAGPLCAGASVYQQAGAAADGARSQTGTGRQRPARRSAGAGTEDVIGRRVHREQVESRPSIWSVTHWRASAGARQDAVCGRPAGKHQPPCSSTSSRGAPVCRWALREALASGPHQFRPHAARRALDHELEAVVPGSGASGRLVPAPKRGPSHSLSSGLGFRLHPLPHHRPRPCAAKAGAPAGSLQLTAWRATPPGGVHAPGAPARCRVEATLRTAPTQLASRVSPPFQFTLPVQAPARRPRRTTAHGRIPGLRVGHRCGSPAWASRRIQLAFPGGEQADKAPQARGVRRRSCCLDQSSRGRPACLAFVRQPLQAEPPARLCLRPAATGAGLERQGQALGCQIRTNQRRQRSRDC